MTADDRPCCLDRRPRVTQYSLDLPSEHRRPVPQRLPSVNDDTGRRDHCQTIVIGLKANFVCDKGRPVFPVKP